ncbi:uncharacterized protein [Palaemon carinicauda]|uniref:uncharacterized protein n=1 Tax=Palaemon carinicauda TaxID=392227 RepID=UPI0035B6AAA2
MECDNHRRIKLTEHGLKVLERVLEERLRETEKIGKQQYEFMRGRGTVNAIFIIGQLRKKRLEGIQKLFCAFEDLDKAYDRIPREAMFWCLRRRKVPEKLVRFDDLLITAENEEKLQRRAVEWQEILERGGLRVNGHKTETMNHGYLCILPALKEGDKPESIYEARLQDARELQINQSIIMHGIILLPTLKPHFNMRKILQPSHHHL